MKVDYQSYQKHKIKCHQNAFQKIKPGKLFPFSILTDQKNYFQTGK